MSDTHKIEKGNPLGFFFNPKSVAIVGASSAPGKLSGIILESLKNSGFAGRVYPVNPKYKTVGGLKCHKSIADIKKDIDVAVFALPALSVPDAMEEAAGRVKGAIVIGGGFGEAGLDGAALEGRLKEIAKKRRIRVIGPNCMGIYDTISKLDTFFIPNHRIKRPLPGGVSIASQSGSFAVTAMDELAAEKIGVARVISYGNRADVSEADCLEFLADDENTKAVVLYVESVEDGRRFVEAASLCASKKPVMVVKAGKGAAGVSAAASHTGAIAGRLEIYRAAFKKAGVIELSGYEEFICACRVFGSGQEITPPAGNRVMIITDGGGMGVGIADECLAQGLDPAPLSAEIRAGLKGTFPSYFTISNPMDLTGSATNASFAEAFAGTMNGDAFDMAIVAALWGPPGLTDGLVKMLSEKANAKPVIVCSPGGEFSRKKLGLFRKAGLPVFSTPEGSVRAAALLSRLGKNKRAVAAGLTRGHGLDSKKMNSASINKVIETAKGIGRTTLIEPHAKEVLRLASIQVPRFKLVKDLSGAIDCAGAIGYPVALKVVSPDVAHKTDVGGVCLGLRTVRDIEDGFSQIILNVADEMPMAFVEGFLVEEMVPAGGVEVIVGAMKDAQFGPFVMFGIGGVAVEIMKDVSFRLAPVTREDAREMMGEVKGFALLTGFRGRGMRDIDAVADVIVKLSGIIANIQEIKEIEINPLVVYHRGAVAVDARAALE
ncbi:MAG: acetate--CoA ligase family protein [Deltaproteobacteria bacterium]|nr:acetate--CoA ligase family protein [Deltaproteobacteria bacterium]